MVKIPSKLLNKNDALLKPEYDRIFIFLKKYKQSGLKDHVGSTLYISEFED